MTVTIPDTVQIGGVSYKVSAIADNTFSGCTKLTKITIEKNVTAIGNSAFYGCKKLKTVTLGKNVSRLGKKASYGCGRLKTLTIKSSRLKTKKIVSEAFAKIPKSMTVKAPKKKLAVYKSMLIKKGVSKKSKFKK